MYHSLVIFAALLIQRQTSLPVMRDPAYSPDGRLAVSIDGDLWIQRSAGRESGWVRVTNGPAWDRQPVWSSDGASLVFVSDRGANTDLWRLNLSGNSASSAPERLTTDPAADLEPSVGKGGNIVFTRGEGALARLWMRDANGTEKRLTSATRPESGGAFSPDGSQIAYVQGGGDGNRRLRVRAVAATAGARDSVVVGDRNVQRPSWSRDGARLAFASDGARPGVYVAAVDGRYVNLASARFGHAAWSPDGKTLAIAPEPNEPAGYNGDPARQGDRDVAEALSSPARLSFVNAPRPPDDEGREATPPPLDRASRNAELFDRAWRRVDETYYAALGAESRRATWRRLRDAHRPKALAASDDVALEQAIYAMMRERPTLRPEVSGRAAVSSAHPVASAAGIEILLKGGNVVDAAVAVSFALGVVEPDASGVGGYGEMLVQLAGMERPALIEFMARVPEEGSLLNAGLLTDGHNPSDGPVVAMVPGTVAGMHTAWRRFGSGKLPWKDLLAPAIRAARDGYEVSQGLATTLQVEREGFDKYPASKALFYRDGKPRIAGDTIKNPDLAWTLEKIASGGADGFYKGEVAERLVNDLRGKGNAIRATDMARYFAPEREPVQFTYRQNTIFSSAPPAAGGAILAGQLGNLEQVAAPKPYTDDAATLHAMIAAWQLAPSMRGRVADPGLWPTNVDPFTNKDTARVRWRCFDAAHAMTPSGFKGDTLTCAGAAPAPHADSTRDDDASIETAERAENLPCGADHAAGTPCRAQGTTAFVVGDAAGNLVAVTQTLGTWGGNFYVSPGLGFLYNDKLNSYATDPSTYGARLPNARHGSSIAPTIVFKGIGANRRPWFAIGAAGNAWINAAVYSGVVAMSDFGMGPQAALELPRFLPRQAGSGDRRRFVIDLESGLSPDVRRALEGIGYHFNLISHIGELRMGYGSAVLIDGDHVRGGGDPRRSGTALATGQ
ncbi:MAG: gamma-glutamyltransferase [Gemmatimonadaceae bacterium]